MADHHWWVIDRGDVDPDDNTAAKPGDNPGLDFRQSDDSGYADVAAENAWAREQARAWTDDDTTPSRPAPLYLAWGGEFDTPALVTVDRIAKAYERRQYYDDVAYFAHLARVTVDGDTAALCPVAVDYLDTSTDDDLYVHYSYVIRDAATRADVERFTVTIDGRA